LEIINNLSTTELLATAPETLMRIVKETGTKAGTARNKVLRISSERRSGNNWNSTVEAVEIHRGKLMLDIYVQMDSTDTNHFEPYLNFSKDGNYTGKVYTTNYYGDSVPHYFTYDRQDKAGVIKSILLEYLFTKYADKL
jgi:hypothetical protein